MDKRLDTVTSERVNVGLVFQRVMGESHAREYLESCAVPIDVINRVLSEKILDRRKRSTL